MFPEAVPYTMCRISQGSQEEGGHRPKAFSLTVTAGNVLASCPRASCRLERAAKKRCETDRREQRENGMETGRNASAATRCFCGSSAVEASRHPPAARECRGVQAANVRVRPAGLPACGGRGGSACALQCTNHGRRLQAGLGALIGCTPPKRSKEGSVCDIGMRSCRGVPVRVTGTCF